MTKISCLLLIRHSADPGPVRNLRCQYDLSRSSPLVCNWSAPEHPNGRIKHYLLNLTDKEETIFNITEETIYWQSGHRLKYGGFDEVSVSTVTYAVGPSNSTRIIFINSGEIQNCLLWLY